MNRTILKLTGAILTTAGLVAAAPAIAQTSGGSGSAGTTGGAGSGGQTYTTETNQDHSRNWGWIGLLGLAGLMGMRKKNDDGNYRDNNPNRRPI